MSEVCYGYYEEVGLCLIYGIPCDCDPKHECYHRSQDEYRIKMEGGECED